MTPETALENSIKSTLFRKPFIAGFASWTAAVFTFLTLLFLIYYFFELGDKENLNLSPRGTSAAIKRSTTNQKKRGNDWRSRFFRLLADSLFGFT
jgi:hypothetical protein